MGIRLTFIVCFRYTQNIFACHGFAFHGIYSLLYSVTLQKTVKPNCSSDSWRELDFVFLLVSHLYIIAVTPNRNSYIHCIVTGKYTTVLDVVFSKPL